MGVIVGTKVRLRPITKDDTELIVRWRNTPFVRNNFIFQEQFTSEMHNKWIDTRVKSGTVIQYIIEDRQAKVSIGSVYFRDVDYNNMVAEYGVFIGENDYIGKGYGSEVAKLFTDYGIKTIGLKKIILRVFADNIGAIKSYINAGYRVDSDVEIEQCGEKRKMYFMSVCCEKYGVQRNSLFF